MEHSQLIYLACVLGAYPALLLATVIHEIGHAVFASLVGYRVTSLGLGYGKLRFRIRLPGGVIFYVCQDHPRSGNCWTTNIELVVSRWREALRLLGGVLANLLVAGLCLSQASQPLGKLWIAFALFNLSVAFSYLVPVHGERSRETDSVKLLQLLFSRHKLAEHPGTTIAYRKLWQEIGDTHALRFNLVHATSAAFGYGLKDSAIQWLTEAEALPSDDSDVHLLLLRARFAAKGSEQQRELLETARNTYKQIGSESGVYSTTLSQYLHSSVPERAKIETYVTTHPLAHRREIQGQIVATQLILFVKDKENKGDFSSLETLINRYEETRRAYRYDKRDLAVYLLVTLWRKQNDDDAGAALSWEKAQKAMRDIAQALSPYKDFATGYRQRSNERAMKLGFPLPFDT